MPTVPVYDTPQARPEGAPNVQVQGLSPRALAQSEDSSLQVMRAGQNMMDLGATEADIQTHALMMANQVRKDASVNRIRTTMDSLTYDPQAGYLAQTGQAAIEPNAQRQGLVDQYGEKLRQAIDGESQNLGNEAQRQLFAQDTAKLYQQFTGQVQSHVMKEYRNFGLETQKGTIDLAADAAQKSWNDPDVIDQQIASAKAAVWKAGQIAGEPANLTDAKILGVTSAIHLGVINAALQNNNPTYAQRYLDQYKDAISAKDLLKATGEISGDMRARRATGVAQQTMDRYASSFQPTDADRMLQITRNSESGGRDYKDDGTPVVSKEGAMYGMQVMPSTAANPGYGIRPAADNSPGEFNRVGGEKLAVLVKRYAGDPAKAWAAYNAGEGNVDKAIDSAGPGGNWMEALAQYQSPENHKQTVDYVTKNVAQLNSGGGLPPIPSLQTIHNNIRQQFGPDEDPRTVSASLSESTKKYTEAIADRKTQGDNAVQRAQQYLLTTKGDFNSLPPDMKAQVIQFAPDKWDNLQAFADKIVNPPKSDNMAAWLTAFNHPEEMAAMPDPEFQQFAMTNFKPETQKQLAKMRQDEQTGTSDTSAGAINSKALSTALGSRLLSLGIDPAPKPDNLSDRARVATIQKTLTDGIFDQQKQLGRKMTAAEVTKFVDEQFLRNSTTPGWWGIGTQDNVTLKMKLDDVPHTVQDALVQELKDAGVAKPTDDQVLRFYWFKQNKGQK